MSAYQVNKLCYRSQHDLAFRERLRTSPIEAAREHDLFPEERDALLAGAVDRLFQMGAHPYLLGHLQRHGLFGLNRDIYQQRMRSLLPVEPEHPDQPPPND